MRGYKLLLACIFASAAVAIPVSSPADENAVPVAPADVAVVPAVAQPTDISPPSEAVPNADAASSSDTDITIPEDKSLRRSLAFKDVSIDDNGEISTAVAQAKSSIPDLDEVESHIDQYEGDVQNFLRIIEKDIRDQIDKKYAAKYAATEAQLKADYDKAKKDLGDKCVVEKSTSSTVNTKDGTSETINTSTQAEIDGKKKKKRKIVVNVTNTNTQGDQTFNGNAGAGSQSDSAADASKDSLYNSLINTGVSGVAYGAGAGAAYALLRNRDNKPAKPAVKEAPTVKSSDALKKSDQDALNNLLGSDASKNIDLTTVDPMFLKKSSAISEEALNAIANTLEMTPQEIKDALAAEKQHYDTVEKVAENFKEELEKTPDISPEEAINNAINKEAKEMEVPREGVVTTIKGWLANIMRSADLTKVDIVKAASGIKEGDFVQLASAFQDIFKKDPAAVAKVLEKGEKAAGEKAVESGGRIGRSNAIKDLEGKIEKII